MKLRKKRLPPSLDTRNVRVRLRKLQVVRLGPIKADPALPPLRLSLKARVRLHPNGSKTLISEVVARGELRKRLRQSSSAGTVATIRLYAKRHILKKARKTRTLLRRDRTSRR